MPASKIKVIQMLRALSMTRPFEKWSAIYGDLVVRALAFLVMCVAADAAVGSVQGTVSLEWDPVSSSSVGEYEVHYGPASGDYRNYVSVQDNSAVVTGLVAGKAYYFAARACETNGTNCSAFSNEVSTTPTTQGTGQLTSTLTSPAVGGTVNLTGEGVADWVHWGKDSASSVNRKAGVTAQIGALTTIGGSAVALRRHGTAAL